jgi:hypothetical protein
MINKTIEIAIGLSLLVILLVLILNNIERSDENKERCNTFIITGRAIIPINKCSNK